MVYLVDIVEKPGFGRWSVIFTIQRFSAFISWYMAIIRIVEKSYRQKKTEILQSSSRAVEK